jgi:hypothetical protein
LDLESLEKLIFEENFFCNKKFDINFSANKKTHFTGIYAHPQKTHLQAVINTKEVSKFVVPEKFVADATSSKVLNLR